MLNKIVLKLKKGDRVTVVAFGDSLTQGWMVRKGYVDFVHEMLKQKYPEAKIIMKNKGIPGDTAEGGLHRLRQDVIDNDPDLVLVQFALNDAFSGFTASVFKNYMSSIIETIKESCEADILLVTSSYLHSNKSDNELALGFYKKMMELADEHAIDCALVHERWKSAVQEGTDFNALVQYDGVHPSVEGYRLMAEAIMAHL